MHERRISRGKLIRLGATLGLGSAGASVIAACGGDVSAGNGEAAKASGGPVTVGGGGNSSVVGKGETIAKTSEVAPNSALTFTDTDTGQPAVLVHLESGEFVAYSAVCTHKACTVAYQSGNGKLACPCHGSVFDPAGGGKVVNPPAQSPLPEVKVEVRKGKVVRM